jgi:LAS superfamily LD-carboxypeptidase LdcB
MKKIILIIIIILLCSCKEKSVFMEYNFKNSKYYIDNNLDKYISYSKLNNMDMESIVREVNVGLYRDYYVDSTLSDVKKDYLILVNKYNYLESNYVPNDLEYISDEFNKGSNNMLRKDARIAFELMCRDAKDVGLNIYSSSAYRSYDKQVIIYDYYKNTRGEKKADLVSARAGYSEHQSGLAVDVNTINSEFVNTLEYDWLINNSYKYGFILRYPKGMEKITGYQFEPWHFRYVGIDIANKIYNEGITFDEYYVYYK